jgi:hypothetical protein
MASPMRAAPTEYSGEAGAPKQDETDNHAEVLSEFNGRFKHSKSHWSEWRTEARSLYDLKAGRQWDADDESRLREEARPCVTFNVADKYADVMVGLQINNRQDIRFFPREAGDAQVSELMTGAVQWGRDLCDASDDETDAFLDAMWTGIGCMEGYLDKDLEVSGVPACQRVDNMEVYPDPGARKRNFADARYVIRLKEMEHEEYEDLFGEAYESSGEEFEGINDDDGDITVIEEPQDYNSAPGSNGLLKRKKCVVADYQYWKREKRWIVTHPQQGQKELTEAEYEAYKPFFERAQKNGQQFAIQQIRRKVYYRAWISKGRIATGENGFGLSPYQGGFTYHLITGKRDRNKNTWYGIGRAILEPQKWLNKFFSTILYSMMTNAKGGLMAEEDAFKDVRKAESDWANPAAITWLKKGALMDGKVQPKPPAPYPQGMDRLMEFTLGSLPQVTGMPVELMGLTDKVQTGVVEAQRKQGAMSIIAWAFDAMRRYYRSIGRQLARYVVDYVPEGTLVMINGETSKQYVPIIKKQLSLNFDVVVDEAPTSVNQQERVWAVLEGMIPQLLQSGIPITPKVLDYSPLPPDLVAAWKKMLEPTPEKQQMQQRTEQATVAKVESEVQKNQTQAQLNAAKAQETQGNAQTKPGETQANTELKQMQALKAAAEAGAAQAGSNRSGTT